MKYSVITFITNNYEPVREIVNPQDNVEYILVTDDKNLKSDTWKVVYEPLIDNRWMTGVAKAFLIRYNCDKYVSNDVFVRLDSSMVIKESLDPIIKEFNDKGYDYSTMYHHSGRDFFEEYDVWEYERKLDPKYQVFFREKCKEYGWDETWKSGLCEIGFQICRKSDTLRQYFDEMLDLLFPEKCLIDCDKNDQCFNSLLLMTKYDGKLNTWLMSNQIIDSKYINIYHHGLNIRDNWRWEAIFKTGQQQIGYWRNEKRILNYFT